ncbi:MAG: dTDP-4-dehydrorhamnose 3,5-epimerase [Minisyncoccia bacterium]
MSESFFVITELELPGVLFIRPKVQLDNRGFFAETFREEAMAAAGITRPFVQDNLSFSKKGVLRGLHFQRPPHVQAKLVRCAAGKIFDVVVDFEPESRTFGKSTSAVLSGKMQCMLYVPGRYAHGFCALSGEALVEYKVDDYYHPESASGVRYDDPAFDIFWPMPDLILSEQDKNWPLFKK